MYAFEGLQGEICETISELELLNVLEPVRRRTISQFRSVPDLQGVHVNSNKPRHRVEQDSVLLASRWILDADDHLSKFKPVAAQISVHD